MHPRKLGFVLAMLATWLMSLVASLAQDFGTFSTPDGGVVELSRNADGTLEGKIYRSVDGKIFVLLGDIAGENTTAGELTLSLRGENAKYTNKVNVEMSAPTTTRYSVWSTENPVNLLPKYFR